mgnify:CR=1 FL=1
MPFNINGHVFTVFGNGESAKGFYSVASFYQRAADGDAMTVIGISGFQSAGQDAWTIVGISGYQRAGRDTGVLIGISGHQEADRNVWTIIGVSVHQRAEEKERWFGTFAPLTSKEE